MVNFHCWGTNFRIVGLEKLEKVSLQGKDLKSFYNKLNKEKTRNIVILSTCNRLEFYWTGKEDFRQFITSILIELKKDIQTVINDFYFLNDFDAFRHLLFVILGFDSMLDVEEEISSQVKNSYLLANTHTLLDKRDHSIFQNMIYLSRLIKNKYNFSQFRFSLSDYLVKITTKVFSNLSERNLLIIGTGLIAKNVINKMYDRVKSVSIYSQSEERINNLMVAINKKMNKCTELNNLSSFDILVSVTNPDGFVIDKQHFNVSKKDKIILFDLGLPRNIAPAVTNLSNVFLFTLDDIYNFHKVLFKDKENEFNALKNNIEEDIDEAWGKILLDNENIDWFNIKEKIKLEVSKNLNDAVHGLDSTIINKLSHNILKSFKEYLIKCKLLSEQEEVN